MKNGFGWMAYKNMNWLTCMMDFMNMGMFWWTELVFAA